jgi:3-oxoacyl-[acyl-carrier protein] reductase
VIVGLFSGQVVLVTGAGVGIGRAIALAFARAGAIVAANDLTPVNLDATIAAGEMTGGQIRPFLADMGKKMPIQAMLETVRESTDRIDILVNAASVHPRRPLLEMDDWDWQRTLDVNLSGPFYLTQSVGRIMREQGGGTIIHIGPRSEWGQAATSEPSGSYLASKTGLLGLTRAAVKELSEYRIGVYAVCPDVKQSGTLDMDQEVYSLLVAVVLYLCNPQSELPPGIQVRIEDGIVEYRQVGE